jgi:hypothetical protein
MTFFILVVMLWKKTNTDLFNKNQIKTKQNGKEISVGMASAPLLLDLLQAFSVLEKKE